MDKEKMGTSDQSLEKKKLIEKIYTLTAPSTYRRSILIFLANNCDDNLEITTDNVAIERATCAHEMGVKMCIKWAINAELMQVRLISKQKQIHKFIFTRL